MKTYITILENIYVNYDKDEADQKEYITNFFQEELPRLEDDIKRMQYCQKKNPDDKCRGRHG